MIEKRALNEHEAANYIGLSPATLRQCRGSSRKDLTPMPRHINIGRAVRYLREDLDAFLDEIKAKSD